MSYNYNLFEDPNHMIFLKFEYTLLREKKTMRDEVTCVVLVDVTCHQKKYAKYFMSY